MVRAGAPIDRVANVGKAGHQDLEAKVIALVAKLRGAQVR
jgi:hypothetical protein